MALAFTVKLPWLTVGFDVYCQDTMVDRGSKIKGAVGFHVYCQATMVDWGSKMNGFYVMVKATQSFQAVQAHCDGVKP